MRATTKETSLSALRHLLTALGAIAASRGYATESQSTEIVGAIVLLVGAVWGPLDEYLTAQRARLVSEIRAEVLAQTAANSLEQLRATEKANSLP